MFRGGSLRERPVEKPIDRVENGFGRRYCRIATPHDGATDQLAPVLMNLSESHPQVPQIRRADRRQIKRQLRGEVANSSQCGLPDETITVRRATIAFCPPPVLGMQGRQGHLDHGAFTDQALVDRGERGSRCHRASVTNRRFPARLARGARFLAPRSKGTQC